MFTKGLLRFWLLGQVEGGPRGIYEGDSIEAVSSTYCFFKMPWFAKFDFNMNFFFEVSDVSINHFLFADGRDFEDSAGEGGIVCLDRAGLVEASQGIACHFSGV